MTLASVTGTMTGIYIYDQHGIQTGFYRNARDYENIVPHEPTGAIRDAGRITFSEGTYVDSARSVGYVVETETSMWCIAPVRDEQPLEVVQYWAVGPDCCSSTGDFNCDDSAVSGRHGG